MPALRSSRWTTAACVLLVLGYAAAFTWYAAQFARYKPFWLDETNEIADSCGSGAMTMLLRGAHLQCSPPPLYYILQGWVVGLADLSGPEILVYYRLISLASAAAALALMAMALLRWLGPLWAGCGVLVLASQALFQQYAAENRPYMPWLLAFLGLAVAFAGAVAHPEGPAHRAWMRALAAAGVVTSFVCLPGALQAGVSYAAAVWLARRQRPPEDGARWLRALWPAALCGAIGGYYYFASSCRSIPRAQHLAFEADRASGVRTLLEMLWSSAPDSWVPNLLCAVGVGVVALRASKADRTPPANIASALSLFCLLHIALTVPIVAAVVREHYYFLPRLFIYLLVCRALLVAVGGWWLLGWLRGRLSVRASRLVQGALAVAIGAALFTPLDQLAEQTRERRAAYPRPSGDCREWKGSLVLQVPESARLRGSSLLVGLGEDLRRCGWRPGPRSFVLLDDEAGSVWAQVAPVPHPGAAPLEQCGRAVVLEPR